MGPEATSGGEGVQRASKRLSEFLSDELLAVLSETAREDDAWREAIRGPEEFLRGRDFDTPDDMEVRLYEMAIPTTRGATPFVEYYCEPPLVVRFFPATIKECAKKAVIVAREWDPGLGGFAVVASAEICLVWSVRHENRWYCGLPELTTAE